MKRIPDRVRQIVLLGFICLLLVVPVELHSTVVELDAHDVRVVVSVDARHADKDAHFEHSAVEVRTRCAACTLTQRSEAASLHPFGVPQPLPRIGTHQPVDLHRPASRPHRHTPSRAPPPL